MPGSQQGSLQGRWSIADRRNRLVATAEDRLNTLLVLNGRGILG
jgi:hypothetical protein